MNGRCESCESINKDFPQYFLIENNKCIEKCGKGLRITEDI